MKNKLLNFLLATILIGSNSCASATRTITTNSYSSYETHDTRDFVYSRIVKWTRFPIVEDIGIEGFQNKGVEDLVESSDNLMAYSEFKKRYGSYDDKIIYYIKQNKPDNVNILFRELTSKLRRDSNIYSKEYLERLKGFEYIKRNFFQGYEEVTQNHLNPGNLVHDIASIVAFSPNIILNPSSYRPLSFPKDNVGFTYYDEIRVRPFYSSEEIIGRNIRESGKR
ncbi:MAG: hypothetical protein ABIH72_02540 [archaeon]